MDFKILSADSDDLPIIFQFLKNAAFDLKQKGIHQWSYWLDPPTEKKEWVQSGFENHEFYFIEIGSERAGMFRLMETDELYWGVQKDAARYLHSLVVVKEFSGQQIGQQVIQWILAKMKLENISLLRLDCDASNRDLCAYYEKKGFVKVGAKQMPLSLNNLYELRTNHSS